MSLLVQMRKRDVVKKERWRAEHQSRPAAAEVPKLPELPDVSKKRTNDWIYGDDDFSTHRPEDAERHPRPRK